eukprot:1152079-Pelagomonas_calceolata.AAC.18
MYVCTSAPRCGPRECNTLARGCNTLAHVCNTLAQGRSTLTGLRVQRTASCVQHTDPGAQHTDWPMGATLAYNKLRLLSLSTSSRAHMCVCCAKGNKAQWWKDRLVKRKRFLKEK